MTTPLQVTRTDVAENSEETHMNTWSRRGQASINAGPDLPSELTIEQEVCIEQTNLPMADQRWTFTDTAGHFHAYSAKTRLSDSHYPTLDIHTEHQPCDGSCGGICQGEGYTTTSYSCAICGEAIEPGVTPGPHTFPVEGLTSWHLTATGWSPAGGTLNLGGDATKVSVRFVERETGKTLFGAAYMVSFESDTMGAIKVALVGTGPLGETMARAKAVSPA